MRRGFTMVEMMVVIAVIATLAVMAVPAISAIQKRSKYAKCGNNLRQIGAGIEGYMSDHDDISPPDLGTMSRSSSGLALPRALFICPADVSRGQRGFNREGLAPPPDTGTDKYYNAPANEISLKDRVVDCSYFYEISGEKPIFRSDELYFFSVARLAEVTANNRRPTWLEAKRFQQKFGNFNGNVWPSGPLQINSFPSSSFPIVRCYWHNRWTPENGKRHSKVINISWDYNVFDSIPWWECQVNVTKPFSDGTFYEP